MENNQIGFSHGVLHQVLEVYSAKAINTYKSCSTSVLEICINKVDEVKKLNIIPPLVDNVRRKSIHLPSDTIYRNDETTKKLLQEIISFYHTIGSELILVHPDLVKDWRVFDSYPANWAIENMDNQKQSYKTSTEIENFFTQHPNWKFVLDLNHCFSNDDTMKLADELIKKCQNQIAEIHLSGHTHEPVFKTKQNIILDYCQKLAVPIVIESTFNNINEVKKEYEYITDYLKLLKK
ncbi:MAG: hypothetical protein WC570_03030 [Patescibacteria group bacterium]